MADLASLQQQLAANESQRNALAAQLGPMTDAAQQAYDTMDMFNPEGKTFSASWTGSLNGVTYTDPQALYAAAQADFQAKADLRKQTAQKFNALFPEKDSLEQQIDEAKKTTEQTTSNAGQESTTNVQNAADSNASNTDSAVTVQSNQTDSAVAANTAAADAAAAAAGSPTNPSATDANTAAKYADPTSVPIDPKNGAGATNQAQAPDTSASDSSPTPGSGQGVGGIGFGGVSSIVGGAVASFVGGPGGDLRSILRVPASYFTSVTSGPGVIGVLKQFGGIIFPYTPTISFDHSATYNGLNPVHSNYTQYFYKNSSVSNINVTAKFSAQNEGEAAIILGIIHLLRALTKMRFGPDSDRGSPPPVCRFDAYGPYMLKNIPVTVTNFRHELPDGVDYIQTGKLYPFYGVNLVPVLSTISLVLQPTYSRSEMQKAGVADWLAGKQVGKGYL